HGTVGRMLVSTHTRSLKGGVIQCDFGGVNKSYLNSAEDQQDEHRDNDDKLGHRLTAKSQSRQPAPAHGWISSARVSSDKSSEDASFIPFASRLSKRRAASGTGVCCVSITSVSGSSSRGITASPNGASTSRTSLRRRSPSGSVGSRFSCMRTRVSASCCALT